MKRADILKLIMDLEHEFPVNSWYIGEIQVWPFIRIQLTYALIDHFEKLDQAISKRTKLKQSNKSKWVSRFSRYFELVQLIYYYRRSRPDIDYLFVGSDTHRTDFNGLFINKFFQPIVEFLKDKKYPFHFLEYGVPEKDSRILPDPKNTFNLNRIFKLFTILEKKHAPRDHTSQVKLEGYVEFETYIKERVGSIGKIYPNIEREKLIGYATSLGKKVYYCERILKRLNPGFIFELCYYHQDVMCLNIAARQAGISTIEIMHGYPSSNHFAYANWNAVDKSGYDALPNKFWCWDQESIKYIKNWSGKTNYHDVFAGGHPWLDYIKEKKSSHRKENQKKSILITTQPIGNLMDDFLLETIKNTAIKYEWGIRLHPRQLHRIEDLRELLQFHNLLDCVNVEEATFQSLPEILTNTDLHITKFSGTTIEAKLFGIRTIFIDQHGFDNYQELIKNGMAMYIESPNAEKLTNCIEGLLNNRLGYNDNGRPNYQNTMEEYFIK